MDKHTWATLLLGVTISLQRTRFNGCQNSQPFKAELNLFRFHFVLKIELTLPIVQNMFSIGQLKIGSK